MPFLPGQSGNPNGRPKREAEAAALDTFRKRFNNGSFAEVLDALMRQDKKGNVAAIKLILEYLLGKPSQEIDLNQDGELKITVEYVKANDTTT